MNPFLSNEMANQHIGDLRRQARARRAPESYEELELDQVTVRASQARDRDAVRVLAALEGQQLPSGPMLVAEVNDAVVAALPLDGGKALADPFKPTAQLVTMLELRAKQLRDQLKSPRAGFFERLRRVPRAA